MSVRVVARIRPLLKTERETDIIVRSGTSSSSKISVFADANTPKPKRKKNENVLKDRDTVVKIPNPKNEGEEYSFQFNGVYGSEAGQQEVFDAEVAPTIKHLLNGFDVTLFAYGVTGTGKTHTMRGGKSLADRGMIPRLLSGIYRRSRKMEKDSNGETSVEVTMSYYEIYNDKVFDLFEPPEKRTPSGLPLRDSGGKTVVVGLTEKPCMSLKEFELLYDQANTNRSTSATKLNAHSSRSHAILCVRVAITTGDQTRVSTASAIDLAGSEDNRRTENGKERMVESASINKSLFVLAQCVEAISRKQSRIPYRESKMTRILSLGQNNGLTVMILNLAPVRSYHLDTVSSLNFANRTKKIEVREVENDPIFKCPVRPVASVVGSNMQRQPLRPLAASVNVNLGTPAASADDAAKPADGKPVKAFTVFSDKSQGKGSSIPKKTEGAKRSPLKRRSEAPASSRPTKSSKPAETPSQSQKYYQDMSAAKIEEMVEKKVEAILAARAANEATELENQVADTHTRSDKLSEQVQRRLELLEQRMEGKEDARAEGLSYLLMAKQHHSRGEDASALKMYQLALPFFPSNEKLIAKILKLGEKMKRKESLQLASMEENTRRPLSVKADRLPTKSKRENDGEDRDLERDEQFSDEECNLDGFRLKQKPKKSASSGTREPANTSKSRKPSSSLHHMEEKLAVDDGGYNDGNTPRTSHLLRIINTRDVSQIKLLKGVGAKKAEAIVDCLCEMDDENGNGNYQDFEDGGYATGSYVRVKSLAELGRLRGVGLRTVENMRNGVEV
ncbi:hypothetical protein FQN54_004674 [Arachnomyces sp. PD_36]|nr:hypothetical protein FQN54_004674 [Arachnomyces sp. PD_36]